MTRFHMTPDGPKPCQARKRLCKYSQHFYDNEKPDLIPSYQHDLTPRYKKHDLMPKRDQKTKSVLPKISLNVFGKPMNNNSYYGAKVDESALQKHLQEWKAYLGDEAIALEEAKVNRDRNYSFHVTLIDPKEYRKLKKNVSPLPSYTMTLGGIGTVSDGDKQAWFITCTSPEVDKWRAQLGLSKKHLHITIGFRNGDVFTVPKDESSIVIS